MKKEYLFNTNEKQAKKTFVELHERWLFHINDIGRMIKLKRGIFEFKGITKHDNGSYVALLKNFDTQDYGFIGLDTLSRDYFKRSGLKK